MATMPAPPRSPLPLASCSTAIPACALATNCPPPPRDHGVAAPAQESRGVVATGAPNGHGLVLGSAKDFLLVTDIDTGETTQYGMPAGVPGHYPYGSIMASNGRFYTCHGKTFMEFDPAIPAWTFHGVAVAEESCYLGFTESPDGVIWAGGCPQAHLISFNPTTRELKDHGRLDREEQYVNHLAADRAGWIYAGIGTARWNLVAYNPEDARMTQLVPESERAHGTAYVYAGEDGKVYARTGSAWQRLLAGRATPIRERDRARSAPVGNIDWPNTTCRLPDGRRITAYSMPERTLTVLEPATPTPRRISFDYNSEGAVISSIAAAPDGRIYGSSGHPMHFFAYTPGAEALEDWGPVPTVGGGNFCALATQGSLLLGAQYADGKLWAYDTAQPWNPNGTPPGPLNPRPLAQWRDDICRPRTALGHPDGRTVMMAGFADYGFCGGGIGMVDLRSGATRLLTAEKDLLPGHSCITLKALPNGNLVGGTSIAAPGGGHPTAKETELFVIDWQTKRLCHHAVPIPGETDIVSIEIGPDGRVYGLSAGATFFVFDPDRRVISHCASLSRYGNVPRHALHFSRDQSLYALLSHAILRIDTRTLDPEKLTDVSPAATAGGALLDGVLYYAAGAHFWSYGIPARS